MNLNDCFFFIKDLTESDEHCRRFLERCMPESFQKVSTDSVQSVGEKKSARPGRVKKWAQDELLPLCTHPH